MKRKFIFSHAPNNDKPTFFHQVFEKIQHFTYDHLVIGGDYNTVLDNALDRNYGTHKNKNATEYIKAVIESLDWIDIWREFNPDSAGYTWGRKASNLKERLDWFLINQELYQEVECVGITTGYKTDHCMVIIVILIESNERGPGFWKFNNSLLEDADYVEKMDKFLDIELSLGDMYFSLFLVKF